MRIASFGCSLTFGSELSDDCGTGPSKRTWPALVASVLGAEYVCLARGGSGNLLVMDRVSIRRSYCPDDFFIINWTFANRFDYSDPAGWHFHNGINDYLTARPSESDLVSEFYFRHMHSEYRDKITSLISIKITIDYLVSTGTKFLMTSIDPILMCQRWHAPQHVVQLQNAVRPYICEFEGKNFLDWSRYHEHEITKAGHPLDEAHAAAAEIMMPEIKRILEPGVNKK